MLFLAERQKGSAFIFTTSEGTKSRPHSEVVVQGKEEAGNRNKHVIKERQQKKSLLRERSRVLQRRRRKKKSKGRLLPKGKKGN